MKRKSTDKSLADNGTEKSLSGAELINPYSSDAEKSIQIEEMFDSIAPAYDFMNTAMTLGLHRRWRDIALNKAKDALEGRSPETILDIATGTGDVAFRMLSLFPDAAITGVDLSTGMLDIARKKAAQLPEPERKRISFEQGDSLKLRFRDNEFSLITVAYGVRNFERLAEGYAEMHRVLKPGGVLCVIELSVPASPLIRAGYNLYSRHLIPFAGRMISGDSRAYSYLPESIAAAPQRDAMTKMMREAGFKDCRWKSLTLGAVTFYIAHK